MTTNGGGTAIHAVAGATGSALVAETTGTGYAGYFSSTNAGTPAALRVQMLHGSGPAIWASSSQGTGMAGDFEINNAASPAAALKAGTTGTGNAGWFVGSLRVDGAIVETVSHTPAWDANYIYICVATNTWKRAAIAAW